MIKENIYSKLNISPNYVFFNAFGGKEAVLFDDILEQLIQGKSGPSIAKQFNRSGQTFNRAIKKLFPDVKLRGGGQTWSHWILSQSDYKLCGSCSSIKPKEYFSIDNSTPSGLDRICKNCKTSKNKDWYENNKDYHREYLVENRANFVANNAKRRANIKNAVPPWADLEKIKEIYNNCPNGYHVDHIHPLKGKHISGLHVENNLQYLLAKDNLKKGNKF